MEGDGALSMVAIAMMAVLVLSALFVRRPAIGTVARGVAGWIVIFGVAILAFSFRNEIMFAGERMGRELNIFPQQQTRGATLVVPMGADGHFTVDAEVNGVAARFMIDSGATVTAVGPDLAREAGVKMRGDSMPMVINTANGSVLAERGSIATLRVGPISAADLGVVTSESFGAFNVLGMNFLSSLKSWRVEGREMILVPQDATD